MTRHLTLVAQADRPARRVGDDRLHALAALAGDELLVLLAEALARAEERRLDRRAAHAQAIADLGVGAALELAHHEDLVMGLAQPGERPLQPGHRVLLLEGRVGRVRGARHPPALAGREVVLGVERDLLGALGAPEGVDARVLGDLVDPRLEGDRALRVAHPAQRGDEDLLRDVLGAGVVAHHAAYVRRDPPLVAPVELLERAVVTAADARDQRLVGRCEPTRRKCRARCGVDGDGPRVPRWKITSSAQRSVRGT